MPKAISKSKKHHSLRMSSNLHSKQGRAPSRKSSVVKQKATSSKAASLLDDEVEVHNVDSDSSHSHSSTTTSQSTIRSIGITPVARSPSPSTTTPIVSSELSTAVSRWISKTAKGPTSNDRSTRQILSQLATAVPLSGSGSQSGGLGVNFKEARHEAIHGLKPEVQVKGKVI